jgi:fibronectin type 3 domain-containing protein
MATAVVKNSGKSGKTGLNVNLRWSDNATNATGYGVQRSTDGVNWTTLTSSLGSSATSYTDTTAGRGTTYYYRVYDFNSAGKSPFSNTATVATPAAPLTTNPTTPKQVSGTTSPSAASPGSSYLIEGANLLLNPLDYSPDSYVIGGQPGKRH